MNYFEVVSWLLNFSAQNGGHNNGWRCGGMGVFSVAVSGMSRFLIPLMLVAERIKLLVEVERDYGGLTELESKL